MPPPSEIHRSATVGFQQADAYDAHRPSYPAEAVQKLLSHLGAVGQRGVRIVDLAAGTGKLTELLAAREEQYRVAAVEPHQTMRSILEAKQLRGVVVREGTAEAMEIDDGWADAVVVAQVSRHKGPARRSRDASSRASAEESVDAWQSHGHG